MNKTNKNLCYDANNLKGLLKKNTDPRNNSNTHTLVDMAYHMAGVHDIHLGLCSLLDDYHHRLRDVILDCGLENALQKYSIHYG